MARARNIKPGFFMNETLADIDPLGRLLFIGLWTLADYKGDLEWRPKRIKAQVLPYDECDIEGLAINLDKSRFVTFYSHQGETYLHINNFERHQNPHPNERKKGSDIPSFCGDDAQSVDSKEVTINHDKSRQNSEGSVSNRADSLSLIPDSLSLIPEKVQKKFTPPTVEEVREYCQERGNDVDPQKFVDHYEANGWIRGKTKIKSWKACVRTWESEKKQESWMDDVMRGIDGHS